MKNREIDVLHGTHTVVFPVPSTIEEGDNLVGETGAVLEGFIDDNLYRNTLPRFYKGVAKELNANEAEKAQQTGTDKKKDGTEKPVFEAPIAHIERVFAAASDERKVELRALFDRVAGETQFYQKGERGGFGKVSQAALDASNGFFAEGEEKVEKVISYIEKTVPGYKVLRDSDGAATPESVARGVQALNKHVENEAKRSALAGLASVQ